MKLCSYIYYIGLNIGFEMTIFMLKRSWKTKSLAYDVHRNLNNNYLWSLSFMFHMDAWEWKYLVKVQYQPVGRHNTSKRKKAYYEKSYLWILTVTPPSVTPEPVKIAQTIGNCFA